MALALLVIAYPCALVISTPVSIASAIGSASRKGILIKGGRFLEALGKIQAIAFDKTGTLTLGQPYISDLITFNDFSPEEVLADAAGIEKFSSHPLAKAILEFTQSKGVTPHSMRKYQNLAGKGSKATCLVCNDLEHCIGNLKLIQDHSPSTAEALEKIEKLEDEKLKKIQDPKQKFGPVAMVGDGVNDAPSLATATVGIVIGTRGSDVAIETADITLMNNDLLSIPHSINLGKKPSLPSSKTLQPP